MSKKSVSETCLSKICTTPRCPFRQKSPKASNAMDFSTSCDYYSTSGDGRWGPAPAHTDPLSPSCAQKTGA